MRIIKNITRIFLRVFKTLISNSENQYIFVDRDITKLIAIAIHKKIKRNDDVDLFLHIFMISKIQIIDQNLLILF